MNAASAYTSLEDRFRRLSTLDQVAGVLHWDLAAIMPSGGAETRAAQLAELEALRHGMLVADDMGDLLDAADAADLDGWRRANLKEMRDRWIKASALTEDLVVALSRASSTCEQVWRQARPDADFKSIVPSLSEVLKLAREAGGAKAERLGVDAFDAMMDDHEPGARAIDIDPVFDDLADFLPGFLDQALSAQAAGTDLITPEGPFPTAAQRDLATTLMTALGFDFDHGRLDESLHPFCGGVPDDVRITTRYDEDDFTSALMGVLHETGHAMYERGLPMDWRLQPVGEALGMSIHESQSLLIEMQVCRSPEFLTWAAPIMRAAFDGDGPAWEATNLGRLYRKVERGFIRVEADEVTYPLHVILRYRMEKALIAGDLAVADIPGAWNDAFEALIGVPVPSDREGCLQDIHWYAGALGYFPTYTLGAMTAAQLYQAARIQDPAIVPGIATGDFKPLMAWLRANVHGKGRSVSATELVTAATGKPLDANAFKSHLRARYLDGVTEAA